MTREKLDSIFSETKSNWEGDNAFQGLQILSKYKTNVLAGADHDIIYSIDVDEVLDTITDEDAIALAKLNWMIDEDGDYFSCFV